MKTGLYTGTKAKARAHRILKLYDESKGTQSYGESRLYIVHENRVRVIYSAKDKGGMIITKNNQGGVWRIMFVAFEEKNRGKGMLKRCFKEAKKIGCDIALVDMNMDDDWAFWAQCGFGIMASLPDLTLVAANRQLPFLNKVTIS